MQVTKLAKVRKEQVTPFSDSLCDGLITQIHALLQSAEGYTIDTIEVLWLCVQM